MSLEPYDFEVVWLTSGGRGTPHAAALQAANPDVISHVWSEPETGVEGWRNCDRNVREFWLACGDQVQADRVLFLEYDVFVNVDLRTLIPPEKRRVGLVGARLMTPVRDGRTFPPFGEVERLPREMRGLAIGIVPFAVALLTRAALDALAQPQHDALFKADIFCELRFPTMVRVSGFAVEGCPLWPAVTTTPRRTAPTAPGLYHPVKFPVL